MILAKVVGTVVSTIKHPAYAGRKLLLVRPLHLANEKPEEDFIAVDGSRVSRRQFDASSDWHAERARAFFDSRGG
jgi:hypothetical protein